MTGDTSTPFDPAYWEDRYRSGEGAGRHEPSPSLVAVAEGLPPGRALDAGCGVGADALWLAARGWQVTAVDVSVAALEQGRRTAEVAGPSLAGRVDWVHADLAEWEPGVGSFDLVSSQYVHLPGAPERLFRRLASWVAPGGTLLVVGHDAGRGDRHQHPPGARVHAGQVVGELPPDTWSVLAAESRSRTIAQPAGGHLTLDDVVVHARRRDFL